MPTFPSTPQTQIQTPGTVLGTLFAIAGDLSSSIYLLG